MSSNPEQANSPLAAASDDPVAASMHRGNRKILEHNLSPFETEQAVIEASRKPLRLGLLVLTDKRLLYVQERVLLPSVHDTIELSDIERVEIQAHRNNASVTKLTITRRVTPPLSFIHLGPLETLRSFLDRLERTTGRSIIDLGRAEQRERSPRLRIACGIGAVGLLGLSQWIAWLPLSIVFVTAGAGCAGVAIWPADTRQPPVAG